MADMKKDNKTQNSPEEPILFEESYMKAPKSPPWILIGFLVFVLLSGLWKRFVAPHFTPEKPPVVQQQINQDKRPVIPPQR